LTGNVEGVRLGRTSYSWSMEFDIVELRRETKTRRRAEENCWNKQGLRQFGYYPRRNSRTRWKFADRAERRKSLRQSSLYENELYDVMHFSKYGIVANNYDGRSSRIDDCRTGLDSVLAQTNSKWIWFAIVRLRRTGLSVEVATGRTLVVGRVRLTDSNRCSRRTPQQSRPHPLYEAIAYVADERQVP